VTRKSRMLSGIFEIAQRVTPLREIRATAGGSPEFGDGPGIVSATCGGNRGRRCNRVEWEGNGAGSQIH
jgi:hypothetical protein